MNRTGIKMGVGRRSMVAVAAMLMVVAVVGVAGVARGQSIVCAGAKVCSYSDCCRPLTALPQTTDTPPKDYETAAYGCAIEWKYLGCRFPVGYCGGSAAIPSASCP